MKGIRRVATLLVGFGLLGATAIGQTDTNSNPKDRQNWFTQMLQERSKAGMMADQHTSSSGSTYVPLDSWIDPALDRLQALGYVDFAYLGLRPWTRSSITHMLDQTEGAIDSAPADEEAREIYLTVRKEVDPGTHNFDNLRHPLNSFESAYTHLGGIAGTPLNDSFISDRQL